MQLAREGSPPSALRLPQTKLSRKSNQIARGRIRQFESDMPSHAVSFSRGTEMPAISGTGPSASPTPSEPPSARTGIVTRLQRKSSLVPLLSTPSCSMTLHAPASASLQFVDPCLPSQPISRRPARAGCMRLSTTAIASWRVVTRSVIRLLARDDHDRSPAIPRSSRRSTRPGMRSD